MSAVLPLRVLCGPTGSAKTQVLHALAQQGEQVLDLEQLAGHRGSVLGAVPGIEQPSQKNSKPVYSRLWQILTYSARYGWKPKAASSANLL